MQDPGLVLDNKFSGPKELKFEIPAKNNKEKMREPGFEPGSQRWQRRILTTILLSQDGIKGI